jgi:hypothetical protein
MLQVAEAHQKMSTKPINGSAYFISRLQAFERIPSVRLHGSKHTEGSAIAWFEKRLTKANSTPNKIRASFRIRSSCAYAEGER